jgi:hypothetical protein
MRFDPPLLKFGHYEGMVYGRYDIPVGEILFFNGEYAFKATGTIGISSPTLRSIADALEQLNKTL